MALITQFVTRIHALIQSHLAREACPKRLARSIAIGIYIALCPFVGFHTALVFALSWLLGLNTAITFAVSCGVNNPWTMIPIYALDHMVGGHLCTMIRYTNTCWSSTCLAKANHILARAGNVSLSAFLLGGNLLALGVSGMLYPILLFVFTKTQAYKNP